MLQSITFSTQSITYRLWWLWLLIAMLSLGWYWFISDVSDRFDNVDKSWLSYNESTTAYHAHLAKLQASLGYGGLIHNFKNYILRSDASYISLINDDFAQLFSVLNSMQKMPISNNEKNQLFILHDIISQYHLRFNIVQRMIANGRLPAEIDKRVKVEDIAAFAALTALQKTALARSKNMQLATSQAILSAQQRLALGYIIVIFFILFGIISARFIYVQISAKCITEKAYKRIDSLLETIPDAMLIVNIRGHIVRANDTAAKLFGYASDELIDLEVEQLVPQKLREKHAEYREQFNGKPYKRLMGAGLILSGVRQDGLEFPAEISINYDNSDTDKLIIITVRDVSERERQRLELIAAKERSDVALADLEFATDALVEAEKLAALGNLVAGVAHEVNTPVGLTLTAATYLQDKTQLVQKEFANDELTAEGLASYFAQASESTRLMEINARRAAELVQSFKQVAVDQSSHTSWRKFDLDSYLHEVALSLYPAFKHSKIAFLVDCEADIEMHSDAGAIAQLVTNLVNNALLHAFDATQTGELFIKARKYDEKKIEIVCSDDGRGMAKDVVDHIFEPFYTTKRGKGGSGLGMYIVHNLLRTRLHGDIKIESKLGVGTRLIIRIPQYLVAPTDKNIATGEIVHHADPS